MKHKKALLLILFVLLLLWSLQFSAMNDISYIKEKILSFGSLAPLAYILIMAAAIVITPIPSLPLAVAAGAIWGHLLGTLYSVIGAEIGALSSFFIARKLGRAALEKMLKKDIRFCDQWSERKLAFVIFASRLLPIFQFDIISYGAGLTNISPWKFAAATLLGMIPATFLFVHTGQGIFATSLYSTLLAIAVIIAIFLMPILIKRYNLFGLKDKISVKEKK